MNNSLNNLRVFCSWILGMKTVDAHNLWTRLAQDDPATFPDETRAVVFTMNIVEPETMVGSFIGGWSAEDGSFFVLDGGWNTEDDWFLVRRGDLIIDPGEVCEWRYFPLPEIDYQTKQVEPMG